ncbi:MAG TPA: hypothetical protein VIH52_04425 [Candidatus Nanoarchaeia archaeon]
MNRSKIFLLSFFLILFALAAVANPSSVRAAATLYLSPASKTVNNGENFAVSVYTNTGGDPVNAVQANLSYPTATLQFISVDSSGSAFEIAAETSGGSGSVRIGKGTLTPKTGVQLVGIVNFKAIAAGTASVSFASGSAVLRSTDNANILSGPTGGTYTVNNPPSYSQGSYSSGQTPTSPPPSGSTTPSTSGSDQSTGQTTTPTTSSSSDGGSSASAKFLVSIKLKDELGIALSNVKVKIPQLSKEAITNKDGEIAFTDVPSGKYNLEVEVAGQIVKLELTVKEDVKEVTEQNASGENVVKKVPQPQKVELTVAGTYIEESRIIKAVSLILAVVLAITLILVTGRWILKRKNASPNAPNE